MNENLTIALDPSSGISLQAQIRQSIVELILNHSILPGDKLPSSRMLSQQLKVSRNTVIFAYQALVDTGYLQPRERSGYVVSDDAPTTRLVDTPGAQHLDHQNLDHQLGDRPNLRQMMMPRVAKLIGAPSWCNLAAISGRCKSQSIGANIAIHLFMGRWMMNYFRILNGVIVRVRP